MTETVSVAMTINRDLTESEADMAIHGRPNMKFDLAEYWRGRFLEQEAHASRLKSDNDEKGRRIVALKSKNKDLQGLFNESVATGKGLLAAYTATNEELEQKKISYRLLKKSDRQKGKTDKQFVALKAVVGQHKCRGKETETEKALREALANANRRIQELEEAGNQLLDAFDYSSDDEENDANNGQDAKTVAELKFRAVLEDDTYEEQKALQGSA
jgi:hypothetical protein